MTTEKRPNRALNLHLGELKEPWEAYCAQRGLKPGVAIRHAIEQQLQATAVEGQEPTAKSYEPVEREKRERYEITLTPSEKEAIRRRLDGKRTMRDWIAGVIRAALTREPQFGAAELVALADSTYQLQAIGRNLNQIARRLNEGRRQDFPAARIDALERVISKHTKAVAALLRASEERWPIR